MESLDLSELCCDISTEESSHKASTVQCYSKASKPHSTPLTLKWLEDNYEIAEGVCLPRSTLYQHYMDFCLANDTNPVNAASFGKIIRQQFPLVTTRRLGTRGQSKYHYYGIGLKGNYCYNNLSYHQTYPKIKDGITDSQKQVDSHKVKSPILLPDFPNVQDMVLPDLLPKSKVLTFVMMYRTHCQRILDVLNKSRFEEVSSLMLHFWQGMPSHMVSILHQDTVVQLVGLCDHLLYRTVLDVIMPPPTQPLPESFCQMVQTYTKHFLDWNKCALTGLPENLQHMKLEQAASLVQMLKRMMSLNHLVQTSRAVLTSLEVTSQLLQDWLTVDLNSIIKQTLYTLSHYTDREHKVMVELCYQFEKLLEDQGPMEAYVEWLDNMIDSCVLKISQRRPGSLRNISRQFLLMWSCFGTRVIRDMTLHSAPSFGSFHLIHLMFNDYLLHRIEMLHNEDKANELLRAIKGETIDGNPREDSALPDPALARSSIMMGACDMQIPSTCGATVYSGHCLSSLTDSDYDSHSECCSDESLDGLRTKFIQQSKHSEHLNASFQSCIYSGSCVYQTQHHHPNHEQTGSKSHFHQHHHQLQEQTAVLQHQVSEQCRYSQAYSDTGTMQAPTACSFRSEHSILDADGQYRFHCASESTNATSVIDTKRPLQQTLPQFHAPENDYQTTNHGHQHAPHSKDAPDGCDRHSVNYFPAYARPETVDFTSPWASSATKRKCTGDVTTYAEHSKTFRGAKCQNLTLFS